MDKRVALSLIWSALFILKIVAAWNGMGMSVFALASRILKFDEFKGCFPADEVGPEVYLEAGKQVRPIVYLDTVYLL